MMKYGKVHVQGVSSFMIQVPFLFVNQLKGNRRREGKGK